MYVHIEGEGVSRDGPLIILYFNLRVYVNWLSRASTHHNEIIDIGESILLFYAYSLYNW